MPSNSSVAPVLKHAVWRAARSMGLSIERYPPRDSLARHTRDIITSKEVNCVLDVGAHEGGYAGFLREDVGFSGYIVSFEPTLSSFSILQNRMAKDAKWRGWRSALGSQSGAAEINLFTNRRFDSLLPATALGNEHMQASGTEIVDVRRVDEVFAEVTEHIMNPIVLLKTDTQGFDLSVIQSAKGVLERIAVLQAEVPVQSLYEGAPSLTDFLTSVRELGFDLTGAFPVNRDKYLRILDMDCLFVPRLSDGPRLAFR